MQLPDLFISQRLLAGRFFFAHRIRGAPNIRSRFAQGKARIEHWQFHDRRRVHTIGAPVPNAPFIEMSKNDTHRTKAPAATGKPLAGLLVVALEQAVAAPYCSSRLADAGARVIKIERAEGDFARGYDRSVNGESSYFVWINRGKESVALNLKQPEDLAVLERMIASADVFLQNLAPGAAARMDLGSATLRARHPSLIT